MATASAGGGAPSKRQWVSVQKQLVPRSRLENNETRHEATINVALKLGHLQVLDQDLILESQVKKEAPHPPLTLEEVQRLDLRSSSIHTLDELTIMSCVKLRICTLSACFLEDISPFYACINLLKLDLSDNQIAVLPLSDFWSSLRSLQILYLNGNLLSGKDYVVHLNGCHNLRILTLYNTPLYLARNYRHHVVNSIFSLKALDQHVISDEEIIENIHMSGTFTALSTRFKLPLHVTIKPGTSLKDEFRILFRLLLSVNRIISKYSPVAIIQRWIRGWLVRRALLKAENKEIRELVLKTTKRMRPRHQRQPSFLYRHHDQSSPLHRYHDQSSPLHRHRNQSLHPHHASTHKYPHSGMTKNPPPPPSSPRSPTLERHILGLDAESKKMKYSVHINLGKLQQNAEHREHKETGHALPLPPKLPQSKKSGKSRQSVRTQDAGVRTYDGGAIRTQISEEANLKPIEYERTCIIVEQEVLDQVAREAKEVSPPTEDTLGLISGTPLTVLPHETMPDLISSRKENGAMIRQAEKEIVEHVHSLKQPPATAKPVASMTRDDFMFTRVYATMNLAQLKNVDKLHLQNKKKKELSQKALLVSKVRQERLVRKKKIEAFQKKLREGARDWKSEEDGKLEQRRDNLDSHRERRLLSKLRDRDSGHLAVQREQQDRKFSQSFASHNTLVSNTVSHEDKAHSREGSSALYGERVRQARKDSLEQQEEVRMYLKLRRNRFMEEGKNTKKELNAKMIEIASERLMESKRKIAKEVARREAARGALALAQEDMRAAAEGPGEAIPQHHGRDPVLHTGPVIHTGFGMGSEFKSPSHVCKMVRESHDTWQRGAKVMRESDCLPILDHHKKTPLLYNMMKPYQIHIQHALEFSELNSSSSSIPIS